MILIIAGTREMPHDDGHRAFLFLLIDHAVLDLRVAGFNVTRTLSGGARGVDRLGETWAHARAFPCSTLSADWSLGPSAGPRRNEKMVDMAADTNGALFVARYRDSRGSENILERARMKRLHVIDVLLERAEPLPRIVSRQLYLRGK